MDRNFIVQITYVDGRIGEMETVDGSYERAERAAQGLRQFPDVLSANVIER